MAERVLLIDQGNTRLKWLQAAESEILPETAGRGSLEEFRNQFPGDSPGPDQVLFSSVASASDVQAVEDFAFQRWGIEAVRLVSRAEAAGVINGYEQPHSLGVDRWLAILGAVHHHGIPVVIWDLGTASTLDAVNADREHLGGLILPGPRTMLRALKSHTQLRVPEDAGKLRTDPAGGTADAIRRGVYAAQLGALNQFLKAVTPKLGGDPSIVITGGAAEPLLEALDFEVAHDPWLVFRGMLVA